jgi:predicted metal-dependent hydrolase
VREADKNEDGTISFPEFKEMMQSILRSSEMIDRLTLQESMSNASISRKEKKRTGAGLLEPAMGSITETIEEHHPAGTEGRTQNVETNH